MQSLAGRGINTMKKYAPLLILTAATMWGSMGLFTRTLTALGYTPFQLVFSRACVTSLCLIIYFLIFDREKLKIKLKDFWIFLSASIVSVVFFNYCYMNAINTGSVSIAATLLYTSPIFVMIISAILFKEKITGIKIIALIMSFTGCILVSGILSSGNLLSPKALAFGIGSGFTYGMYSIFTKIALKKYSPLAFTAYTFLISAIISLPLSAPAEMIHTTTQKSTNLPLLLLFALITNVIPYTCFTTGLKHMEAGKANITATVEPVIATVFGVLVFHETLTFFSVTGICLVLSSAILLNIPRKTHAQNIKK